MSTLETRAVHAGRRDLAALGVHVPSIDLSTTNPLADVESGGDAYEALATGGRPIPGRSLVYGRLWNPTVARFEDALAELEGCEESVAFASGMAALTACLLAMSASGKKHVVAVRPVYGGTDHLLDNGLLGAEVTWVGPKEIEDALRPDTGLVVVETPANPTLELLDLDDVSAQAGDIPVLVDNTFATPVLQQPMRHGAALVLHSATKFIGGHGDAMAGVVAAGPEWASRLRQVRAITGGVLHPLAGYLLHRGLQTLPLRVKAQQASAQLVAEWLVTHPNVDAVHFPGLLGCDPDGIVGRQMAGPGSVMAFEVVGGYPAAVAVAQACQLVTHAVSLGGTETLIEHPASLTHRPVTAEARPNPGLLRISIGLEAVEDLCADLDMALNQALELGR
jgi:methionine-gamma-lyase